MNSDHRYLLWLYHQVGNLASSDPNRSYTLLTEQLHKKHFRWRVPNDDNRALDGIFLRESYFEEYPGWEEVPWAKEQCSVLEMLVALALRADNTASGIGLQEGPEEWFWKFMANTGLVEFTDAEYLDQDHVTRETVAIIVDRLLDRRYNYDGSNGGLFPLKHPGEDQRHVELWYQLNAYLMENSDIWT